MRIISKWRDYYDNLQSPREPGGLTYVRHPVELKFDDPVTQDIMKWRVPAPSNYDYAYERLMGQDEADRIATEYSWRVKPEYIKPGTWKGYDRYRNEMVLFCGKLYQGIRYTEQWSHHTMTNVTKVYWDADSFHREHRLRAKVSRYDVYEKDAARLIEGLFTPREHPQLMECHFKTRCPVISIQVSKEAPNHRVAVLNPNLKDFQFFRLLDANLTFQEISMFLGGVLSNNDKPEPVDNRYKILAHGFDLQSSFRKEPTKVHR